MAQDGSDFFSTLKGARDLSRLFAATYLVLPLHFVEGETSLKEGNSQMLVLADAGVKGLRSETQIVAGQGKRNVEVNFFFLLDELCFH